MITYQKVYTDHVHSSTLMGQFTQLWKNHLMCDAEIIVGSTVVKAHRLVLVASCTILQSYDNTSTGSVLEVTLPTDIQPQSVNTFLEFLYQGHMILTEDNVQSIERIARLLHVDDVLKCCHDFAKTLKSGIGEERGQFNFNSLVDVNHIRSTNFIKSLSDMNSNTSSNISVQNKFEGQRSSYMEESSNIIDNSLSTRAASSVSFVTSPCIAQRQRFRLGDIQNETHSRTETNSFTSGDHMAEKPKLTQHSIIDLSNECLVESRPDISNHFSVQQQNIDPTRSTIIENSGSNLSVNTGTNLNSKRRHSDQNKPSSFEPSSSNNSVYSSAARSQNNYFRSLSDENLNHNSIRNTPAVSYAAQYGFAMPVLPSPLSTDKALLQQFSSQHNQNPRCSSTNSVTSSCSSKASTSQQVTRPGSEFSDLPICIEQDDSDDNRLVLDVSDIDLSMIKTENVEEPLDLHVEGVPENLGKMDTAETRISDQASVNIKTEYQKPVHSGHLPGTPVYNTTYQQNTGSDISKQWSSQLQMAMIKKRPPSSNLRKIIQGLSLNRKALASPAALGSLAVGNHKPIRMPGKNNYKVCSLCYRNKIRTKSGYYVYSYYKCSVCDVPLCIGRRKCFLEYHKEAESKQNE